MTHIQKEIRQKLQLERQVLSVQVQRLIAQETSGLVSAIEVQVYRKQQVKLASIERALTRLEKGTFGVCQSCGEAIGSARLEALPHAEQCIDCQRMLEHKTIQRYAYAYPTH